IERQLQQHHSNFTELSTKYVVPKHPAFPEYLVGKFFGWKIKKIRQAYKNNKLHVDVVDILNENRFVWNASEYSWQCNLAALKTYKKLNGNLLVRIDFVVPLNDPNWPKDAWGLNLGNVVSALRMTKDKMKPDRRIELEKLGFVWDHVEYNYQRYLIALKTYKKLHGNLFVPKRFVVPSDDPKWPEEIWNLKIGASVQRLRSRCEKLSPKYLQELDKLGFVWSQLEDEWQLKLAALTTLGINVTSLRARRDNLLPEHRNDLDKLGFVWDGLEYKWQRNLTALT
ncbi:Carboxyvinyl-carboxyphosphonate phosphorylmutase, partial [Thraustotheca clavata]